MSVKNSYIYLSFLSIINLQNCDHLNCAYISNSSKKSCFSGHGICILCIYVLSSYNWTDSPVGLRTSVYLIGKLGGVSIRAMCEPGCHPNNIF